MVNKINILYAEDDPNCASLTKNILERKDFLVEIVPNGDIVWQTYQRNKPDILMLDLEMPGKSGIDMIRLVRAKDHLPPIILYSSHAEPKNEISALDLGANDFINKSCHPEVLVSRLKNIYERICQKINNPHIYKLSTRTIYNSVARTLTIDNQSIVIKSNDARFLQLLCAKNNELAEKEYLLERMWGKASYNKGSELKKYASHVRDYLKLDESLEIVCHQGGYSLITSSKENIQL